MYANLYKCSPSLYTYIPSRFAATTAFFEYLMKFKRKLHIIIYTLYIVVCVEM